jgi:diguanylate cyclase (GGDEF)-like protein
VGAERVIERVRQRLADVRFEQIDPAMRVTFSAGIAQCQVGETLSALIERADQAMYAAKQGGRDRSVISEAPVAVPRLRLVASQRDGVPS